jgi:hypothetical protein
VTKFGRMVPPGFWSGVPSRTLVGRPPNSLETHAAAAEFRPCRISALEHPASRSLRRLIRPPGQRCRERSSTQARNMLIYSPRSPSRCCVQSVAGV